MNASRTFLAAAALLGLAAGSAIAQPLAVTDRGENFTVTYDESYSGNIVGGGQVETRGNGNNLRIIHEDARYARHSAGVPVFEGGSEGNVVYLPAAPSATTLAAR
ncbi:hypothetical protein ACFOD4_12830 [Pseudoroseomonas globiformis]|uniref:Uncharacterized protein n=1 Tax=Teichococcus globiformis TaxID=2307229 RepID=A0ABV7G375_9PROT